MGLFGTDGIRGVAGIYPLDDETVQKIGAAAAAVLKSNSSQRTVLVGRDTRESGQGIADLLSREFARQGIEVWDLGVVPTPAVAFLVKKYPALAGIVISASHNPYKDNGIKFFGPEGTKLPDELERRIEERMPAPPAEAEGTAKVCRKELLVDEYREFLAGSFTASAGLKGLTLAIDCANGATSGVAPILFSGLGANVVAINNEPNGTNINRDSGSLHPENLARQVLDAKASCGLAFDGDGDRVIFVDEKGIVRDGDYILTIVSWFLKNRGKLVNNTLVTTVMANLGLFRAMERHGIDVIKTPVGDRYVYEGMAGSGSIIGGEQSGHIIFRDYLSTGDGMLSALQLLSIMSETGRTLSDLCTLMDKYPQILINVEVKKKVPLVSMPVTAKAITGIETTLSSDGRVLVRYSGTENLLRVMIEGRDKDHITGLARQLAETAVKEIETITA